MLNKHEAPRFHNKTVVPDIPEGLKLVKYHGRPAVVPESLPGENTVGPSGLTRRQIQALAFLKRSEAVKLNEERLSEIAFATTNANIKGRTEQMYKAFTAAVAGGEQYLASGLVREALILQEFAP